MVRCGELILKIALEEQLIGNFWFYGRPDGSYVIKDLHPFIRADPITMSALSWVMQLAFALHIPTVLGRFKGTRAPLRDPGELAIPLFHSFSPEVTTADYDRFRFQIVKKYMLSDPADNFCPAKLSSLLTENPITSALLQLCPADYARP